MPMHGVRYGTAHSSWVQAWIVTPRSAAMSLTWHILLLCLAVENDAINPKFGRKSMLDDSEDQGVETFKA